MRRARGEIVFFMDADLSVPLAEVPAFLRRFEEAPQVDVLIGNRQHARSRITRRQSPLREGMGKIFNRVLPIFRHAIGVPAIDVSFNGFRI